MIYNDNDNDKDNDNDNDDKKPEAGWSTPSLLSPPPWQPGCEPYDHHSCYH